MCTALRLWLNYQSALSVWHQLAESEHHLFAAAGGKPPAHVDQVNNARVLLVFSWCDHGGGVAGGVGGVDCLHQSDRNHYPNQALLPSESLLHCLLLAASLQIMFIFFSATGHTKQHSSFKEELPFAAADQQSRHLHPLCNGMLMLFLVPGYFPKHSAEWQRSNTFHFFLCLFSVVRVR